MKKDYAASGGGQITLGGIWGYSSADLLVAALKAAKPNFGNMVSSWSKTFNYNPLYGGSPLQWPTAFDSSVPCSTVLKVSGPAYQIASPFQCGRMVRLK
jgi:hypothetical protein